MPYLASISIYPVKSLEPVTLQQSRVLRTGALAGDRTLALFDSQGKFVNGKRTPLIHRLRSSYEPTTQTLSLGRAETGLTASFHIDRQRDQLQQWLHEFFGMPITLKRNAQVGFPDDLDSPGPTIISTATLTEVAGWFPPLDVQTLRLRLRANLEIGGVPAFWEDRLYGLEGFPVPFRIGDCQFEGNNPCQRCAVPPRDPFSGEMYPGFTKIFAEQREKTLPVWAERSRFNHFYRLAINTGVPAGQIDKIVSVGDEVEIA